MDFTNKLKHEIVICCFTNFSNASMGCALPIAIGAAIGTGSTRKIYCIAGDGGFQMNIQELLTVKKV